MTTGRLTGRTAVVTGGASGIGRATAILLARQGASVFTADFSPLRDENNELYSQLGIEQLQCDVRVESQLAGVFDLAAQTSGRIDVLVNNAGIGMVKQIQDVTEADWDACLDTNLKAAFFGCKHAIRYMVADGRGGAIVNVSSNAGLLPRSHDPVYSISKLALSGLTKSLALCHSKDRIRVNAVCPGPVGGTRMIEAELDASDDRDLAVQRLIAASPLARAFGRMITPEEIAQAVLYLVSDAAIMLTGTLLAIDGGKSLGVPPQPE
ncbi:SDR family oxidoreductase [bacterium]|nr:SDR family oxidoreductase [bacterium]